MTTWKLVPVAPTEEMINALIGKPADSWAEGYAAMLAAAPAPDVQSVAWMNVFDDVNRGSFEKPASAYLKLDEAERQIERHKARGLCALRTIPLYSHPPAADVQELVKALRALLRGIFDGPDDSDAAMIVNNARAALSKLEGK